LIDGGGVRANTYSEKSPLALTVVAHITSARLIRGRDLRASEGDAGDGRPAAGDPHHTDRVCRCFRPSRTTLCFERPGGNITGFSSVEPEIGGKWLGLLKEVAPLLARVAVIFNPETGPFSPLFLRAVETAAPSFAVKPIATPVHDAADIECAISAFAHDLNGGLIVLPSAFVPTAWDK
jgi:hypothetical protein